MPASYVVAGCIARNRGWILNSWFDALAAQSRPPNRISVLLNDCTDASYDICLRSESRIGIPVSIYELDFGTASESRDGHSTPRYDARHLAALRNLWVDMTLTDDPTTTHLWSVDSDVIPDYNVLATLLDAKKPIIAAVVRNSPTQPVWNFFHVGNRRSFSERAMLATANPFSVSMTGACCLYEARLFHRGDRKTTDLIFDYDPQGEDMGLCRLATAASVPIFVHPKAYTSHHMFIGKEPLRP